MVRLPRVIALAFLTVGAGCVILWLFQFLFVMVFCVWGGRSCL
jgi:hypothetical protein